MHTSAGDHKAKIGSIGQNGTKGFRLNKSIASIFDSMPELT